MQDKRGIVIPCFNETDRLDLGRFDTFLKHHPHYMLCFVDDGSSDNTRSVLTGFASHRSSQAKVLCHDVNMGKGESVRTGLNYLTGLKTFISIGFLDADLSTTLDEYHKLNETLIGSEYGAVFGSRIKRMGATIDRSNKRHIIGRVFASIISHTIQLPFYDTQCGAKAFRPDFLEGILETSFLTKWLFDVEIIMRHSEMHGLSNTKSRILEYSLAKWVEVCGSKIGGADFYRIPLDLLKIRRYFGR